MRVFMFNGQLRWGCFPFSHHQRWVRCSCRTRPVLQPSGKWLKFRLSNQLHFWPNQTTVLICDIFSFVHLWLQYSFSLNCDIISQQGCMQIILTYICMKIMSIHSGLSVAVDCEGCQLNFSIAFVPLDCKCVQLVELFALINMKAAGSQCLSFSPFSWQNAFMLSLFVHF